MRIALLVDSPGRDLPSRSLIAWRLAQEGITSYLVPQPLRRQELGALTPDAALLCYLRGGNQQMVHHLCDAGVQVHVLDTEGQSGLGIAGNLAAGEEATRRVETVFSWGTKFADHARRAGWFRDDQLVLTGEPRMDFYAEPWREASGKISAHADGYGPPMVLVNGSFPQGNPIERRDGESVEECLRRREERARKQEAQLGKDQFVGTHGYDREEISRRRWMQFEGMEAMTAAVNRLAARFPEATFIYRPHPFEKIKTYHDRLDQRANLHVNRTGPVDGWILRASAVIQRGCSTGLEAALAGVPSLCPGWFPTVTGMDEADALSETCESVDVLGDALARIFGGAYETPSALQEKKKVLERQLFYKMDGRAHERVVQVLVHRLAKRRDGRTQLDAAKMSALHYELNDGRGSWKTLLGRRLRRTTGLPARWSFREWEPKGFEQWEASFKQFDLADAQKIINAIEHVAGETGVVVRRAAQKEDYQFGYEGRSLVVAPS